MSLFQLKNALCDSPKLILEEIEKEVGKNKILSEAEITKMKNDQIEKSLNQVSSGFLKGTNSQKLVKESEPVKNTEKKVSIDTESQVYTYIYIYTGIYVIIVNMFLL